MFFGTVCFYILPLKRFFNQIFSLNNKYSAHDLSLVSRPPMHFEAIEPHPYVPAILGELCDPLCLLFTRVNSRARLVTLARAYARSGASRRWLGDKIK